MSNIALEESWEFWKPIVMKDGVLDLDAVKNELHDFYVVMQEVPKVYRHITGNLLSKILYKASVVIEAADDHYEQRYREENEDRG